MKPAKVVVMLLVGVACSTDEARVSVQYVPRIDVALLAPSVVVAAPGLRRTLSIDEIGATGAAQPLEIATATTGRLDLEFALVDRGTTASAGTVHVDLRPDWAWGFRITVDSASPLRGCFGCVGAQSFPLSAAYRRGSSDSVWVSWGGNGIKHPVIY